MVNAQVAGRTAHPLLLTTAFRFENSIIFLTSNLGILMQLRAAEDGLVGTGYAEMDVGKMLAVLKYAGYISINGNTGGQVDKNGNLVPGTYTPCK